MKFHTRVQGPRVTSDTHKDLILTNANVITLDPVRPEGCWVIIRGRKILCIGEDQDWKSFKDKETNIIDCRGRTVLPGFIDAHLHLVSYAESLVTIDLRPGKTIRSIADIQASIREYARDTPPGSWIRGKGYNEFYLA